MTVADWLGVAEVSKGDACSREETAVFGLHDERTQDGNASRVGGDGVVDGVVHEEGHRWASHVVGGASDGSSSGTGKVGGVQMDAQDHIGWTQLGDERVWRRRLRMDAQDHIRCPIDLASIRMRRDKGQETVQAGHGGEGGGGLFCGESAGRGEDTSVNAAPVASIASSLLLPAIPWIGWGRLGEKCQAQWGTGGA
jgi:hypothetical protein